MEGHQNAIIGLDFSPDGKTLISGSADGTIKRWDLATGKEIASFVEKGFPQLSLALSFDGKILASGGGEYDNNAKKWKSGGVKLWDVATGKVIRTMLGHSTVAAAVAFSPDGTTVASGSCGTSDDGEANPVREIKLWQVSSGKVRATIRYNGGISSLAFSPDGKLLAVGSYDTTVTLWDAGRMIPAETNRRD